MGNTGYYQCTSFAFEILNSLAEATPLPGTCGETIINALQRIRLEQSIPYLFSGIPLKEIAPVTGFQNEFYYSKVFRLHYGVPPSEWRKTMKSGQI